MTRITRTVQVTERTAEKQLIQVNKILEYDIDFTALERMLARRANVNKSGRVNLFAGIIKGRIKP